MSKISADLKKAIKDIKQFADGNFKDQLESIRLLRKYIFPYRKPTTGINESIIRELLPTFIKFMESNDHELQQEGANSITSTTNTPDEANTKLVIDAGVIPKLVNLLSSPNTDVLISALEAFINIANDFPEKVVEDGVLQPMIQCFKSKNKQVIYQAARFMYYISVQSQENLLPSDERIPSKERIDAIFKAGGVKPLIEVLESSNDAACDGALNCLINIIFCDDYDEYYQRVLDLGGLKLLKKLCDRVLVVKKPKSNCETDSKKLRVRKRVKFLAIRLIRNITSYDEDRVDVIIKENFLPLILQQIKGGSTPEIKIETINVIENVIFYKPDFVPALVENYDIFSSCYSNLGSTNADLLETSLRIMKDVIEKFKDENLSRRKIRECGGPTKLSNLFGHSNKDIRELSTWIHDFFLNIKLEPIAEIPYRSHQEEVELIELSDDEVIPVVETPQNGRQRKRKAPPPIRRSKRFMSSHEQTDTENSDSSSDDDENDQYNDFEDYPRSSSIDTTTATAITSSSRHDHSGRQSFVGEVTVDTDGQIRFIPKIERPPTPNDYDIPTPPSSRQLPDLPASTNNGIAQNETNHSPPGHSVNRSRFSSNKSRAVPEAASTNKGNFRINHVGRPSAVNSETAATADEIFGNSLIPTNPSSSGDSGNRFSRPVSTNSLPEPASTNNGTIPNISPLRNPSPIPQPIIAHELPNQATTAVNDNIIRDESIEYWRPFEKTIHQYCQKLGIQFNRKDYDAFIPKIIFDQITSNSKPDNSFTANDKSGFGCLSILLTGNEDASNAIRKKINQKYNIDLIQSDEEKITKVIGPPYSMKEEHLQTIAALLKCRILVYSNGWKKYGSWETENQMIPLFVLEKNENDYKIILDLKNDV